MKWKRAGSGSDRDVCKSSILGRETEKMHMQKFFFVYSGEYTKKNFELLNFLRSTRKH
jgi:hypothetical protein